MENRKGIGFVGTLLCDMVKTISHFPKRGTMGAIKSVERSVGGIVTNTGINLAKIAPEIPVYAYGKVGNDENGRFIADMLKKYNINCDNIDFSKTAGTSFTDVMSEEGSERTFFIYQGANAEFSPDDIDYDGIRCEIMHVGYILLLDIFDRKDDEYGTVMARFLHNLQKYGIKTSVDMISNENGDYVGIARPAIKYCDYVIINEVEASHICEIPAYGENGKLDIAAIEKMAKAIASFGAKDKVIIHAKEAGFIYNVKTEKFSCLPSLLIPEELIKGSVGAGDTFAAGCLYGIYNGFEDTDILAFASAAAACNLFSPNAIDGLADRNQVYDVMKKFERRKL